MDGYEQIDASLDREIASMLASEPSPEFLARVRTRVAEESAPRAWQWSWVFACATAMAAVIGTVVVWQSREPVPVPSVAVAEPAIADVIEPPVAPSEVQAVRRPSVQPRVFRAVATTDRIDLSVPEVMVAENEAKTFAALVASLRQSRFDVAVPAAPDPFRPLEIKELPPVEPLEIEPIVRLASLQTEGERP
jgi:hypothetical protein